MRIRTCLITVIVILFIFADTDGRRTSGRRSGSSSGWGSSASRSSSSRRGTSHRTTQRPSQTGSNPSKIGWNVPPSNTNNKAAGSPGTSNVKPPVSEHASKTSATNVQSGNPSANAPPYTPSGGYPRQPASNPYGGTGYNQNQGYPSYNANPSYPGYGGHSPYGQAYNPSMHHNAPPAYSPYGHGQSYGGFGGQQSFGQPSYAQPSYVQPAIQQAPALTVLQPSRPGIGQLAKEALVYSSVSAGVSAAVNRLLPGGIYGRSPGYGHSDGAGGSRTEITYNNYYYNQSNPANGEAPAAPANNNGAPAAAAAASNPSSSATPVQPPPEADKKAEASAPSNANSPSPQQGSNPTQPNYPISNDEVKKLSESLFEADKNNAYKYITVNLQGETKEDSTTDDAPLPLLDVKPEAYEIPTIKNVIALHDNYAIDVKTKEIVTPDERKEETELIDNFMETDVFKTAMKYLVDKGFIPNDEYEFKDTLKRIWFSQFQRVEGEPSSSGFEAVFLAEKLDSYMIGPQNWIYFAKQEAQKNLDYRGYIKDIKLADKGEAIKIRSAFNVPDTKHSVTTLLVGFSPELEMALYTICFYLRPNDVCPVSLGGKDVNLVSTRFNYFGKDILIAGFVA
ncbi:PREDICTED: poly(U)-specific endoribonuclease homolog [Cyphomyrmex costatus]|uniref:poly(U)-specific endoribonuclease homolog n=1 Tax=Cyphomyrmex costatus TaxID=456900 RepID=UPI0008523E7C|nr:PREDICTED: poly(U)-specific endoribonuclease homolog [Cyphomyrmex costatus]